MPFDYTGLINGLVYGFILTGFLFLVAAVCAVRD